MNTEFGVHVKNYLNDDVYYDVINRKGINLKGKLTPGSNVELLGLHVGDSLHLWNNNVYAKEILTKIHNAKYIISMPEQRRDILFKDRGYQPITMTTRNRALKPHNNMRHKLYRHKHKHDEQRTTTTLLFIFIFIFSILSIILFSAVLVIPGTTTGASEIIEQPKSIII